MTFELTLRHRIPIPVRPRWIMEHSRYEARPAAHCWSVGLKLWSVSWFTNVGQKWSSIIRHCGTWGVYGRAVLKGGGVGRYHTGRFECWRNARSDT